MRRLTVEYHQIAVRDLLQRRDDQLLVAAGCRGGPTWPLIRQARLLDSIERGWPTGNLLVWTPPAGPHRRWHLLDGHRRVDVIAAFDAADPAPLLRDLHQDNDTLTARYLPARDATPPGRYLPATAMRKTVRFLAATAGLPEHLQQRAQQAATAVLSYQISVTHLVGGTPAQVHELYHRLVPDRITPRAVLTTLATT